ncbi:hypothetical protein D6764_03090 [Candidatus Woesearchaeota archaeon]|nr:MAG: hypothetical protein D6764_03090 [Candidatus Woesearchaeota archaeon]
MNPEREILNFWFNSKGYLTQHNIKVGHNREIYMLALKIENGQPTECIHVETQVSVSAANALVREGESTEKQVSLFVKKKFETPAVKKKIKSLIESYSIDSCKRLVVLGKVPKSKSKSIASHFRALDVETVRFSDVLLDSIKALDGQTYHNNTVRTLQLVKFLLLGEPEALAEAFRKFMKGSSKQAFLSASLRGNEKLLSSKALSQELATAFFSSGFSKPDVLAELLAENLSRRSYNALLSRLFKQAPRQKKKSSKEKPLLSFLQKN